MLYALMRDYPPLQHICFMPQSGGREPAPPRGSPPDADPPEHIGRSWTRPETFNEVYGHGPGVPHTPRLSWSYGRTPWFLKMRRKFRTILKILHSPVLVFLAHVHTLYTYMTLNEKHRSQGMSRKSRAACCIPIKYQFNSPRYSADNVQPSYDCPTSCT